MFCSTLLLNLLWCHLLPTLPRGARSITPVVVFCPLPAVPLFFLFQTFHRPKKRLPTTSKEASCPSSGCTPAPSRPRFPCTTPQEGRRSGRFRCTLVLFRLSGVVKSVSQSRGRTHTDKHQIDATHAPNAVSVPGFRRTQPAHPKLLQSARSISDTFVLSLLRAATKKPRFFESKRTTCGWWTPCLPATWP